MNIFDEYLEEKNPELRRKLTMPRAKTITKKFYLGSQKMNPLSSDGSSYNVWARATLADAIAHAKQKCEEDGEPYIVVQIVRVVRPQARPVIVEKV